MTNTAPLRQKMRDMAVEAMLDSAERCMVQQGYEKTTMQQIAADAGCATGTLYLHFKSKEQVLHAVVNRHSNVAFARAAAAMEAAENPLAQVRAGSAAFLTYASEHRSFIKLFLTAMPMRHRQMHKYIDDQSWANHTAQNDREIKAIRDAQAAGMIHADLPAEYMQDCMTALCMNHLEYFMEAENPPPAEQQVEMVWRMIASGLGVTMEAKVAKP